MALDDRYHSEWSHISRHVRELFNHHCAKCGEHCKDAEVPEQRLQVHHIDENPGNNQIENLIPLCARCHLQIEKEARRHAPYQATQMELFEDSTYLLQMRRMREAALACFGGIEPLSVAQMSAEEYDLMEMEFFVHQ